LRDQNRFDEAIVILKRAIELRPGYAEARISLADTYRKAVRPDDAIAAMREIVRMWPGDASAHADFGVILQENGHFAEAIDSFQRALQLNPSLAKVHSHLGMALRSKGRLDEAIAAIQQSIRLKNDDGDVHSNLSIVLRERGRFEESSAAALRATQLLPTNADTFNHLGNAYRMCGMLDEAAVAYQKSISLDPAGATAMANLAVVCRDEGRIGDAIALLDRAIALRPNEPTTYSNLLLISHYSADVTAQWIFDRHLDWARRFSEPLSKEAKPHDNERNPNRRLRIGYLSPDFHGHVVARFILPLIRNHDRGAFEVFCYSSVASPDAVTEQFRNLADVWRDVIGMSDEQTARQIREDRIDILIDLAGHTAGSRLLVLARKPAPIQVNYQGYADTTGMSAADYRLTDALADPPGQTEQYHTETLIRLESGAWCYEPDADAPPVASAPMERTKRITFGSFNLAAKLSEPTLSLWGQILQRVPDATLLLKARALAARSARDRVMRILAEQGVEADRIRLLGPVPTQVDHLRAYEQVDIALDPFPYHGTTTTCEALWMGVPVITLAGSTHVARVGVSLLNRIGLGELVAESPEQYVKIAADLAADFARVIHLRHGMRERMRQSPLMDGAFLARSIESAYRRIWLKYTE
jgi:predicted O-linked N-acetylglucosamine transferase (SPINDLY family)